MNSIVKLPCDDRSCGWYAALPEPQPARRLVGEQRADHVVIGAGFAGLAAARRLASHLPHARILLVDAQRVGYGASGAWHWKLPIKDGHAPRAGDMGIYGNPIAPQGISSSPPPNDGHIQKWPPMEIPGLESGPDCPKNEGEL